MNTYCPMCGNFHQPITAGCTLKTAPVPDVPPLTSEQLEEIGREAAAWGKAIHERTRHMSAIGPDYEIDQLKERISKLEQEPKWNSTQLRWIRHTILNRRRTNDLKESLLRASSLATLERLLEEADKREKTILPSHYADISEQLYKDEISKVVAIVETARALRNQLVSEAVDDSDQSKLDTILKKVAKLDKALSKLNDTSEMSDPR